jgi:penicillin-binding protein 1A
LTNLHPGDGPRSDWKTRIKRFLLDLDSRLDFGLFQSTIWGRELFERFAVFMDRFHIAGWRRWILIEPLSELGTLGLGGLMLALELAIPAFR